MRRFPEAEQALDEARRHVGQESPGTRAASMLSYRQTQLLVAEGKPASAIAALDAWQAAMDANAQRTGSRAVIGTYLAAMSKTRAGARRQRASARGNYSPRPAGDKLTYGCRPPARKETTGAIDRPNKAESAETLRTIRNA